MEVVIKPVTYSAILQAPNAQALIDSYSAECSIPELGACLPNSDIYAMLEEKGAMTSFGVYKGDELVGFATVLTSILPHYGQKFATIESIFVAPEHRDGGVGESLMATVEQHADENDCTAILYSAPTWSRFDKFLALSDEYRHTNNVYCRRLN